jgi:hypothetical protein
LFLIVDNSFVAGSSISSVVTSVGASRPASALFFGTSNGTDDVTTRMTIKSNGVVNFTPLAADPPVGESDAGDVYYNSTNNVLRVFNGTAWADL